MEVSQPLWFSGCPVKGHFRTIRAKDGKFVKITTPKFGITLCVGFGRKKKDCIYIFLISDCIYFTNFIQDCVVKIGL